jgi:transcriptional regulator with XRE-family HTH domain
VRLGEKKERTQAAFARMLGTTQQTVQGWLREEGRLSVPDGESLLALATAFRLSGHWLLTGEGPQEAPGEDAIGPYRQARIEVAVELKQQVAVVVRAVLGPTSAEVAAAARRLVDLAADAHRQLERDQPGAGQG